MAATVRTNSTEISPEINTTPLIDVMLVLRVMLIITIPPQRHAVDLTTPRSSTDPFHCFAKKA